MGIVNTKEMFKKAYKEGYAVGAFNVNNMEIIQGIVGACNELKSPVVLQVSPGARKYAGHTYLLKLIEAAAQQSDIPIALHLDHGNSFELCKSCIDGGFSSVMIDGSGLEYEENVEVTSKVVEYAHKYNVSVEGELGRLAGIEDEVSVPPEASYYTDPKQAEDFVKRTRVDSLAVAIGTSHGAYKFKTGQRPRIRLDILKEISELLPEFPIVLHGASSIIPELSDTINKYGGALKHAVGVPEDMLSEAAKMAVCKINVDSDLRLVMTAAIRKYMALNPSHFDPRQYLSPARDAIKDMVKHKIEKVMGCAYKA